MKKLLIVFFLLLLLGVAVEVFAQEIMEGKVPVLEGTCFFDKDFHLKKGNPYPSPCYMALDPERNDAMWIVLHDGRESLGVIEVALPDGEQKVVWKKGNILL